MAGIRGLFVVVTLLLPALLLPEAGQAAAGGEPGVSVVAQAWAGPGLTEADDGDVAAAAPPSSAVPGQVVTFRLTVENKGTAPSGTVVVIDHLDKVTDDAKPHGTPTASDGGTITFDKLNGQDILHWNAGKSGLQPGDKVFATYQVQVFDHLKKPLKDWSLDNRVQGGNCPAPPTPAPAGCALSVKIAHLNAKKKVNTQPKAGEPVTYTVEIENPGTAAFTGSPVELSDDMSDVLDDAAMTTPPAANPANLGTLTYTPGATSWKWAATGDSLAAGAKVTVTYTVTVNPLFAAANRLYNVIKTSPGGGFVLPHR